MAQTIKLRRASGEASAGKVPTTAQLDLGEIAINTYDGRVFIKQSGSGAEQNIRHIITTDSETTGSINLIGSITASSGISASGTVTAEHFYSSDDAFINDLLTTGRLQTSGVSIFGTIANSNTSLIYDAFNFIGHVTASGNISMSAGVLSIPGFTDVSASLAALEVSNYSATDISGSFTSISASIASDIATNVSNIASINNYSATDISGSFTLTSASIAADIAALAAGGDGYIGDAGTHTAGGDLNMGGYDIYGITNITASGNISASGAGTHILGGDLDVYGRIRSLGSSIVLENGNITASGEISASGDIKTAQDITASLGIQSTTLSVGNKNTISSGYNPFMFDVKPATNNINYGVVSIVMTGSSNHFDYIDSSVGSGDFVGTYSPPTIGSTVEVTPPNVTLIPNTGVTINFTIILGGDYANYSGVLKLKKAEALGNYPGAGGTYRNVTIGGQRVVDKYGTYNAVAYEEFFNIATPTSNPGSWGNWEVGTGVTGASDFENIQVVNGQIACSLIRSSGVTTSTQLRFTFEDNDLSAINNDHTSGKAVFFYNNHTAHLRDTTDNFLANFVNIESLGLTNFKPSGIRITLGNDFSAPLQAPNINGGNWFIRCDVTNETGINLAGGIAKDVVSNGLYLYGSDLSDERLKENIILSEDGLNIVQKLKVKKFNFKGNNITQQGLIAQEVKEVIPEAVIDGLKYLELRWSKITPYLIKAIQQQQDQIENLQNEINQLKKLIK